MQAPLSATQRRESVGNDSTGGASQTQPPAVTLPKGGGAIRGIGEKFAANPVSGTGSLSIPIFASPGRSGFGPQLALSYDSGAGNGPFGFGWNLSLPAITRKTDKGLPRYWDAKESDVFILSGAEDLVPVPNERGDASPRKLDGVDYQVHRYRPRIEGLFARIERWTKLQSGETHWRSISRDNITTLYGKTDESRLADRSDPTRVFSWLICESYDDKGNAIVYKYKEENPDAVDVSQAHERNRTTLNRSANRHLKSIKFGNRVSRLVESDLTNAEWMFEVVLDYGEHDPSDPKPNDPGEWLCRNDPFSSYRAGFEIRAYRLCQRVLMFHHFSDEDEVGKDCLVRSTDFVYRDIRKNPDDLKQGHPVASFIASVTQSGYKRQKNGGYLKRSLPPIEFEYTDAVIQEDVKEMDAVSLDNLPSGLDGATYRWVDLDGEGVSGVLTEEADAWFYKPNLGEARFGPLERVAVQPSLAALSSGRQQLLDLAGDGQLDLVQFGGPAPGFFERTHDQRWEPFTPFSSLPNIRWDEPNLRFVDLDGDGHADVLITENEVLTWHPSLAEEGFGPAQRVQKALDEEKGPKLVFADGTQSIYLGDMSGDGLTDLVRIRNGEVGYWPNLGYGQFGAKVTMDDSPWFDAADQFDQRRIRLADIDGSGNNDIIYLGRDGVRLYFNQSGNRWSEPRPLSQFPAIDNLSSIMTADLLGNGTACLVWSSPLPSDSRRSIRYVDLMGGQKPHLLVGMKNNLGAETNVRYAPSTRFYLADKAAGRPWITRLAFPVHVVERVETCDRVSRNRFVTRYAYHHGYFDGIEREFRGFGLVEQMDTEEFAALSASDAFPAGENIDAASHVPPVLTKTWFHTGAYIDRGHISDFFAGIGEGDGEYYREPSLTDDQAEALLLDDTTLPPGLSVEEEREACRALKGSILRQEIYALDNSPESAHPYSVSERSYTIERLQAQGDNRHAVFFVHPRETIDYHYERNPADPRVSHALTLQVDDFGNVLRSLAIGYGRRQPDQTLEQRDQDEQTRRLVAYTENAFTNATDTEDAYRSPLPSEGRTYEMTGFKLSGSAIRFSLEDFAAKDFARLKSATEIRYEQTPDLTREQKRLIEDVRTLYRRNDLTGPLPLGQKQSQALPFESYKLAFTPGLLSNVYQRKRENQPLENLLRDPISVLRDEGGYVDLDGNGHWWIPSGRMFFHPDPKATPDVELKHAQKHCFLPHRFQDPFLNSTFVFYDKDKNGLEYDLLVSATRDAVGNEVKATNDYRVLQPNLVTDPNGNRTAAAFDALGMVAGTAMMGKDGEGLGDSLEGFEPDLDETTIADHLKAPFDKPHDILGRASTRLVYDLHQYERTSGAGNLQPNFVYTLAREIHDSDLQHKEPTLIQHSFSYSDGLGREVQKKIQAEPGPLIENGLEVNPRWVGSGWTIFNNKGKPVRKYEPFFSDTQRFEFARIVGVSPVLFYDPAERVVATLHPNHTYEKVVFDPWQQATSDVNDTILQMDPKHDLDVGGYFRRLPDDDYLPTWHTQRQSGALGPQEQAAAKKAAVHANTPTVAFFDTLGRTFLTVAHNRFERKGATLEEEYRTRVHIDIEGNQREVIDAKDRIAMRYDYDMLSNRIHQTSMDVGERWMLNDVAGKPIRTWDSRDHTFRMEYDELRRPLRSHVTGADSKDPTRRILFEEVIYGDGPDTGLTDNQKLQANLRTKPYKHFDTAGIVVNAAYDFKGNLLRSARQLLTDCLDPVDWGKSPPLEGEVFSTSTRFDALNRVIQQIAPHSDRPGTKLNVIQPAYNEANLLEKLDAWLQQPAEPADLLDADTASLHAVTNIDYNAKGQRELIEYGILDQGQKSRVKTEYKYDPETFRLTSLTTKRRGFPQDESVVQDLHYFYDPAGNITHIQDDADIQNVIYFRNKRVEPSASYVYDAIYRLIQAAGREHLGQTANVVNAPKPHSYNDAPRINPPDPTDGNAMGTYVEEFTYDEVGNIREIKHRGSDPENAGWTRGFEYDDKVNNRLIRTSIGQVTEPYTHDEHGNITEMPHLSVMEWDFKDQLHVTQRQKVNDDDEDGKQHQGERTFYTYDVAGQRVRKVTERNGARIKERVYVGGFEVYREYNGNGSNLKLERETLHVTDDKQRIALVETQTKGVGSPNQLVRYHFSNHLGSASLELDRDAKIISYEEYYPYGSTSYQAVDQNIKAVAKRYRYTGKERDEETGLYYHGARYYAPWLGRWTSTDPIGISGGLNLYAAVGNNPVRLVDHQGRAPRTPDDVLKDIKNAYQQKLAAAASAEDLEKKVVSSRTTLDSLKKLNPEPDRELRKFIKAGESTSKNLEKQLAKEWVREQSLESKLTTLTKEGAKLGVELATLLEAQGLEDPLSTKSVSGSFDRAHDAAQRKVGRGSSGSGGGTGSGEPPGSENGPPPSEAPPSPVEGQGTKSSTVAGPGRGSTGATTKTPPAGEGRVSAIGGTPGSVMELDPKPSAGVVAGMVLFELAQKFGLLPERMLLQQLWWRHEQQEQMERFGDYFMKVDRGETHNWQVKFY